MIMYPRCGIFIIKVIYYIYMKNYFLVLVGVVAVVVLMVMYVSGGAPAAPLSPEALNTSPLPATPAGGIVAPSVPQAPTGRTVVVKLSAQNKSGESGTATLTDVGGNTQVTIKVSGEPSGVSQPAHIHVGACPNPGAVKYPLSYPVDGASVTMLDVSLDALKAQLPLAINVHKNSEEAKVYVACGDVKL